MATENDNKGYGNAISARIVGRRTVQAGIVVVETKRNGMQSEQYGGNSMVVVALPWGPAASVARNKVML